MFTIEVATPDINDAFVPFFAQLMADALVVSNTDLDHPDHPITLLVRCGFSSRIVAPCLDHAIRIAKGRNRHAAPAQHQLVP